MLTLYVGKRRFTARFLTILFLIMVVPLILAIRFFAQDLPGNFDTIGDILIWIFAGGGGMWITGKVIALLLENWAWWHTLSPGIKRIFVIIIAGVIAIAAETAYVSGLLDLIPPAVSILLLALINWFFGQKQYMEVKEGAYAASAKPKIQLPSAKTAYDNYIGPAG
ncbi:hypothetical protein LCGC14_2489060 [marine sediment metagenome]|uniref:Uncharacterized protein n=1 Tax=marine sediment metagenome TaxID=412755 RepID=A0A0F9DH67_9ZZZZ